MCEIPDYLRLDGDEDGGVTLYCDHADHSSRYSTPIVYHGWSPPEGFPVFDSLADFVAAIFRHAESHQESPDVSDH